MVVTVRTVDLNVVFAGNALADVLSARGQVEADGGWPTCSVFVTAKPTVGNEEDDIQVTAGAGNNVVRFTGKLRRFRTSGFPKALEMVCMGSLAYAAEWAPAENLVYDQAVAAFVSEDAVTGVDFGVSDQQLIAAVLERVPRLAGTYTLGDIGGTGIALGNLAPEAFLWRAGTSAWSYIQQLDRATLYRTYQTQDGTVRRIKMIGHPNSTSDFTLDESDVLDGSTGNRDTERTRNAVTVLGYDYGDDKGGPVANFDGTYGANDFLGDASNPATRYPEEFNSPLIESGTQEDGTPDGTEGLNAHDIAEQVLLDVNKEFVEATVLSWRDDTHGPGLTCLLDCVNRLAIGEPMWVQGYSWEISEDGWQATYRLSGGGLEQTYATPEI